MKDKLAIGIIRTSYGVNGELKVKSLSGETEHFLKLKHIYLEKKGIFHQFHIEKVRVRSNTILLKLEGIDTPEKGKQLNGSKIWVYRDEACPLEDDEYYYGDLFRCTVMKNKLCIGTVVNIFESGIFSMLEVKKTDNKSVIIPLRDEYIKQIDIKTGTITLRKDAILS